MAAKICVLVVPGLNLVWGVPAALLYAFSRFSHSFRSYGEVVPRLCHGRFLPNHLLSSPHGLVEGQRHRNIHRKHLRPRSLFPGVKIFFFETLVGESHTIRIFRVCTVLRRLVLLKC